MTDDQDKDEMLAAEYAIGLLTGTEQSEARQRAATEPAFARQVTEWEGRLAQMADLDPVAPRAAVRTALLARLFPAPVRTPFWQRLGLWQALSGGALAALIAVAVTLWQPVPPEGSGPLYSAQIASEEGDFRVVAVVDKIRDEVILTRTQGAAPEGRILQVWAHGPDKPAQSVGLWPAGETVRLALPPEIAAVRGTLTLGVSEEPPGGSPSGSPSGRVFGTVDIPNVTDAL
ncbi:anti-sigma factor [Roseovarius nanhaiticus]|uniref:anti-sigma factor n=1 Tax=Roseovarius nanhaiticus TaxID=573024 RepID=UPI002491A546|nr:anti-sigma factor [Roseovarius nanhaiticus]